MRRANPPPSWWGWAAGQWLRVGGLRSLTMEAHHCLQSWRSEYVGPVPISVLWELWLPFEPAANSGGRTQEVEGYAWGGTVQPSISYRLGVGGRDGNWPWSKLKCLSFISSLQPVCVMPTLEAPRASSPPPISPFSMTTTHTVCGSSQHSTPPR